MPITHPVVAGATTPRYASPLPTGGVAKTITAMGVILNTFAAETKINPATLVGQIYPKR